MLTYNTQLKKLVLPEYGRNIQSMVDHCLAIDDREERTRCAYQIVMSMGNLFPELRDPESNDHKLWDHLMIMSDFRLDVDFPCEIVKAESLEAKPEPLSRLEHLNARRHYGRVLHEMIRKAAEMEDGEEKTALIAYLANQMKKLMLQVNRDGVEDEKIFKDLMELSGGKIVVDPATMQLVDYHEVPQSTGKKKKKK